MPVDCDERQRVQIGGLEQKAQPLAGNQPDKLGAQRIGDRIVGAQIEGTRLVKDYIPKTELL